MSSERPRVGAVTVTHNSADVLEQFLESAKSQVGIELYLYIVDSGSSDATISMVERAKINSPVRIVLIANGNNVGFAEGSNQGIQRALDDCVDRVLLINNDTFFGKSFVHDLWESAVQNRAALLSPLILAVDPPESIWYAGGSLSNTALVARHKHEGQPRSAAPTSARITGYGSACCLLIDPKAFVTAGMFDPIFFVYFDDVDLATRMKAAGYDYWFEPRVVLTHRASALTGGKRSAFTLRWTARNWPLMIRKRQRGVRRVVGLLYVQAWIVARLLLRRDSPDIFRMRQRCFREALTIDPGSSVPHPRIGGSQE